MNAISPDAADKTTESSRWKRLAPIFGLIVLAPGIAEVSSGATRLSFIFVLIPEMMVWGCGALLIRELVRRWRAGWTSMLVLGLGLSVAEEFIIQQTSIAPLPWAASSAYGRIWGVNLIYFLFMLGYESVMVVLVPVHLTELIFPGRRNRPWLKQTGVAVASVVFVFGSFIAWFLWTHIARVRVLHVDAYNTPFVTIFSGFAMIVFLATGAYVMRGIGGGSGSSQASPSAVPPWIVGLATLFFGFPWYALLGLVFGPKREIPLWIPVVCAALWASLAYLVARWFTSSPAWSDTHRWAAVFCASLVCMIAGFLGSSAWSRTDLLGKAILNALAVAGFIWLEQKIAARAPG
jgi:hypothetical protein